MAHEERAAYRMPAWRAKRVAELQGKIVRIIGDSDDEEAAPNKRQKISSAAEQVKQRIHECAQELPGFMRLSKGTTKEFSPGFMEEFYEAVAEGERAEAPVREPAVAANLAAAGDNAVAVAAAGDEQAAGDKAIGPEGEGGQAANAVAVAAAGDEAIGPEGEGGQAADAVAVAAAGDKAIGLEGEGGAAAGDKEAIGPEGGQAADAVQALAPAGAVEEAAAGDKVNEAIGPKPKAGRSKAIVTCLH